jgi:hypothetical protein
MQSKNAATVDSSLQLSISASAVGTASPFKLPSQQKTCCPVPLLQLYSVKRVDEVVRHPHLVTQDQFTQVSKKVSDIPEENFTINIELFRHFSQVWN